MMQHAAQMGDQEALKKIPGLKQSIYQYWSLCAAQADDSGIGMVQAPK